MYRFVRRHEVLRCGFEQLSTARTIEVMNEVIVCETIITRSPSPMSPGYADNILLLPQSRQGGNASTGSVARDGGRVAVGAIQRGELIGNARLPCGAQCIALAGQRWRPRR
jgi:hypothetical protein